jgi:hypothetical protein
MERSLCVVRINSLRKRRESPKGVFNAVNSFSLYPRGFPEMSDCTSALSWSARPPSNRLVWPPVCETATGPDGGVYLVRGDDRAAEAWFLPGLRVRDVSGTDQDARRGPRCMRTTCKQDRRSPACVKRIEKGPSEQPRALAEAYAPKRHSGLGYSTGEVQGVPASARCTAPLAVIRRFGAGVGIGVGPWVVVVLRTSSAVAVAVAHTAASRTSDTEAEAARAGRRSSGAWVQRPAEPPSAARAATSVARASGRVSPNRGRSARVGSLAPPPESRPAEPRRSAGSRK